MCDRYEIILSHIQRTLLIDYIYYYNIIDVVLVLLLCVSIEIDYIKFNDVTDYTAS